MKGKKSHNDFGVPQKHSENIPFLSFLQEDFLPKQVQKDARSKIVLDIKEVLIHASAQYKTLLELPLLSFWSTVAHNSYILRSLDSFLCFARRGHFGVVEVPAPDERAAGQIFDIEEQQYKKGLDLYYNELYRVVLNIFLRLSSDPLSGASENIDYAHVIYHNWLFDIPKLLDLCSIYQNGNEEIIQKIIQNVFKVESAYKDDFLELVKELTDKVLPDNLKTLNRHRKREDLDVGLLKADTDEKEKILIFLYDIVENLGFIISMFPKTCRDDLFLDKKFLMVMESAYMNINSARKQWRIQEEKRDVLKALAKKIENDIIFIIETLFNHVFGDVFAKNPSEKVIKNKKAWTQFHHYMNATGKTNLAKKDDEPNFKFLRKLMKNVDFGGLLQKYPDIHIVKEADLENHQVIVMLQNERIEELINRKRALENKEDTATEPSEKPSVNSSPVRDQSLKSSPVKEQPKIEQIPIKKEDIPFRTKEEEGTREAIRIIEMHIGKKDKTKGAFDEDQIREAMKVTLRYAQQNNVYDDEYDDTLEMYEGDRLKVRGDRVEEEDDSDAEEANVEGELDKDEKPRGGPGQGRGGKARHLGGTRKEFEKRSGEKDTRGEYKGGNRGGYHDRNEGERRENKPYAGDGGYKRDYQQGGGYGRDNQQGGGYGRDNQQGGGYYKDRNYDRDNQQGGGYGRDNQQGGGYYKDRNYDNQQGGGYGRDNQQGGGYYKDRNYGGDSRGGYKYEKKEDTREQGQGQGQSQEQGQGQGQGAPHVKGFGAGPAGQYDPKKSNRRAFQDRKHYKDTHGKKEYTPKDK